MIMPVKDRICLPGFKERVWIAIVITVEQISSLQQGKTEGVMVQPLRWKPHIVPHKHWIPFNVTK